MKEVPRDFQGGPVVKNPPYNAGDTGLIIAQGIKILHVAGQLSQHATTTEPTRPGAYTPQLEKRKNPHATTRKKPTHHNNEPVRHNEKDPACLNKDPVCHN